MKTPAKDIKKEIQAALNLFPDEIRVRWGTGTGSFWLHIEIAPDRFDWNSTKNTDYIYSRAEEWGVGTNYSDYDGKPYHTISLQELYRPFVIDCPSCGKPHKFQKRTETRKQELRWPKELGYMGSWCPECKILVDMCGKAQSVNKNRTI